jgi:peptidoglycan hydrolase FlgJ
MAPEAHVSGEIGKAVGMADFAGLTELRRVAAGDTPDARRQVAQQFEALFIGEMMKQMRQATTVESGLFSGGDMAVHEQMYHGQLAQVLARGQGIGLAAAIMRQLGDGSAPAEIAATARNEAPAQGLAPAADKGNDLEAVTRTRGPAGE